MKIEINADGFTPDAGLGHYARCCAGFELGAQRNRIESVQIRLSRVTDARDGKDKSCQVQVELREREKVVVQALDSDLHVAIFLALERASWTVARGVQAAAGNVASLRIVEQHLGAGCEPDRAA